MSYLFDEEDFAGTCREYSDAIIRQISQEYKDSVRAYYQANNTYDGFVPKQETLFFNSDGSISIYLFNPEFGVKTLFDYGEYCCVNNMAFIINKFQDFNPPLFSNINTDNINWNADKQTCRWKPINDNCSFDTYKIALNPVFDDGAVFNIDENDSSCNLTIDFSYLFKFDCDGLSKTLATPDTDPKLLEDKKAKELELALAKTECENISDNLLLTIKEYNESYYSLENDNKFYCINEVNNGLAQLEVVLGPLKYKKFINGETNSYTSTDFVNFLNLNNQSISQLNKELMFECDIPYGTKSQLKKDIDDLSLKLDDCQIKIKLLENELSQLVQSATQSLDCSKPINALESLDVSVTLDVIESDGSLTTVSEFELLPTIGFGNLYNYLVEKQDNSGFYFCSLPKPTETWTTGCTSLIAYELTAPEGLTNAGKNLNISTCNTVKDSLITSLLNESPFGTSDNDKKAFYRTLDKQSFASNWVNFTKLIDDETIINQIKNKKIKLSVKINNSCSYVCIYIDNIKLSRECVNGESKKVVISKSPGFELEKIIDNKKSWVNNTTRVNRDFEIENIHNLTVFRNTDYDVNDERLVINTKEIDLNINIASAIENDVQCFIKDNPDLLDTLPSSDCGCEYKCYEDVVKIISHAEAIEISPWVPRDPEDLLSTVRAVRDAWIKAWNQLMLATAPYLDILNGVYHPNPSPSVMGNYIATRNAWRKALKEFNLASGGGFIDYITIDGSLHFTEISDYESETYSNYEKLAPQIFNTKCGRIMIFGGTWAADPTSEAGSEVDGRFYIVETPENEVKLYLTNSYPGLEKTWIDITNLVQEDYPSDWGYLGGNCAVPEKATYYCKYILPRNYTSWAEMMSFHYQTNNNTSHDEWINSVDNAFFIGWDTAKNKCMTKKFKQSVPEEFSMNYPIISKSIWSTTSPPLAGCSPACVVDYYLRNSGTTNCNTCTTPPDWTYPEFMAEELAAMNRYYRDANLKLINEIHLTENGPLYRVNVLDPNTNMPPDESAGYIPVHVTTTIRKGSRDGDIVFKEEYILNDATATCITRQANTASYGGLKKLNVYVGITDPNCAYLNPAQFGCNGYIDCTDNGTYITGSTSTLPLFGASDNGIDRNWTFDEDYYVHFDVVNNNTGDVYYVTNNDYNLKDRLLPIKCPNSASTQTFDINLALNSINTFKTTILGEIQEDLNDALSECTVNCNCEPNCDEDTNTYITFVDFMDDLAAIPTSEEITNVGSGSRCGCDYSSTSTVSDSYDNFLNNIINDIYNVSVNIDDFRNSLSAYTVSKNLGFCDDVLTQPDITLISGYTFPNNFFYKGTPYKIKGYTPCKASLLSGWTMNNVGVKLSAYTDDITYIKAVSTVSELPLNGSAGNVILVGTPSSHVGYAWDPTINNWSTSFYNDMSNIFNDIEQKRHTFTSAKDNLLRAMKPFTWANNYLPLHSIRLWALPEAPYFSGGRIIDSNGIYNPCPYKITTEACDLLPYCGPYKHVYNNLC